METYKESGNVARRDLYTAPKQSIPMANGSQNDNSNGPSKGPKRKESFCHKCMSFLRNDHDYALYCLSETNPVRRLSKLIVDSKYPYKYVIDYYNTQLLI
jgi:hypothetical protein